MTLLLAAGVFLLPLLILPGLLFHYDITPKVIVLCVGVAACLLHPGELAPDLSRLWNKKYGRWLCLLAAAQIVWYAVVTAASSRPWFSLLGSNWRRMGLVTVVALCMFAVLAAGHLSENPTALRTILRALTAAAIVASVYGIFQYFDIDPLQSPAGYHAQAGDSTIVRPPGTLGHADYFGWWLSIIVFCGIASSQIETGGWRIAALAASVLSVLAVIFSGTRSAVLAVFAGFIALTFLSRWKPGRRHAIAGLLFLALFFGLFFSPPGTRLRARVRWSADEPIGGARPLLWRDSLRLAAAHPLAGFGPETFSAEFPRFQSVELARLFPDFYHESPHNTALDALTSEGIPGLLLLAGWAIPGWKARTKQTAPLGAALLASCTASLFSAVTVGPLFATLLVIAMLVSSAPELPTPRPALKPALLIVPAGVAAICLALFAALLARADYQLARVQSSPPDPAVAIRICDSAARAALPGAGEDLYCARRLATLCSAHANPVIRAACTETSTHSAERATATADNPPNAWYNLAMFYAGQNDARGVESALRTAISLAPDWFKPHWALANFLALMGRAPEAREEAAAAFRLDAGKDSDVRNTLAKLTNSAR